jgi:hypothetical protein
MRRFFFAKVSAVTRDHERMFLIGYLKSRRMNARLVTTTLAYSLLHLAAQNTGSLK